MNKTFFKFDIDDELLKVNLEKDNTPQKVQNIAKNTEKAINNGDFLQIKGAKLRKHKNKDSYEKQIGLQQQKQINQNLFKVDDYINFDFKAKTKHLEEIEMLANQAAKAQEIAEDNEINGVINRAHIGVIFY